MSTHLGLVGTKTDAEEITERLSIFLQEALSLTLAAEQTLITHASTGRARCLGSEIGVMQSEQNRTVNVGCLKTPSREPF